LKQHISKRSLSSGLTILLKQLHIH